MNQAKIQYAEDDKEPVTLLLRLRVPSLVLGLLLGLFLSFITSKFEIVLAQNILFLFFIPFIVYLADAVGTQTQNIFVRDLKTGRSNFKIYLLKESFIGLAFALLFGLLTLFIVLFWLKSLQLALAVSLGIFGAVTSAPIIALTISQILQLEREDPAVWSGPITTVVQDTISVVIYGLIASAIFL